MSEISEQAALIRIGFRPDDERGLDTALASDQRIARIVAQHRSGYHVSDGLTEFPVQAPAAMIRGDVDPRERPAVGDFVVIDSATPPLIQQRLARRSLLARLAAGEARKVQPIAANIDSVLIVCGLDQDYNPRRIERYLLLVRGSGAQPVIVLTKRDLCAESEQRRAEIQSLAGADTAVLTVNARDSATVEQLAAYLGPGHSLVLVGSSGAGKSTLTNTLLGVQKQRTSEVREHDSRGRHTTTHRSLIVLPSGGCLIDTPGMRELKMTEDVELVGGNFDAIETLAGQCRFRDCAHGNEPGCAVQAALADGSLDAAHYAHFLKLRDELAATSGDKAALVRRKADEKVANKALGKRLTEKYGSR